MKINKIGKIQDGEMQGWYIKLIDDTENTGGYLLLQSEQEDFKGNGYDDWFIDLEEARHYIESKFLIEW